jgi:hypothetical protein
MDLHPYDTVRYDTTRHDMLAWGLHPLVKGLTPSLLVSTPVSIPISINILPSATQIITRSCYSCIWICDGTWDHNILGDGNVVG